MNDKEAILEFRHVSKKFRRGQLHDSLRDLLPSLAKSFFRGRSSDALGDQEFWALRDVSFALQPGEALGIIGPNGAGKSTILKTLTGIMNPTSGEKIVRGSLSALIEVGAGFHPDLTGRENIFLNGTILGMSRGEIREKLDEIIDFSGLSDFIDTPVKRYSSGMYARLGFSIACHVSPDILVVDEVLSVGDWAFQAKSMEKMKSILHGGATVIFVSHNLKAVASLCEKVLYLEKGQVQALGPAKDVVDAYIRRASAQAQEAKIEGKPAFIEEVRLKNADEESSVFRPGDKGIVEVTVSAPAYDQGMAVALGFRDENYNMFFYIDSVRLGEPEIFLEAGESRTLVFEFDMHLAPGSYFLNVALTHPQLDQVLDHRAPAHTFVVHSDVDVRGVANLYPRLTRR
jgi:homopolymeric O-antigen transport system ATP-binding protein